MFCRKSLSVKNENYKKKKRKKKKKKKKKRKKEKKKVADELYHVMLHWVHL
jgi:hypothetical protein